MSKVIVDMGMSLDGFIAGLNAGPYNNLGYGGTRIHRWVYDLETWRESQGLRGGKTNADDELVKEAYARVGAYVMGRRMFDEGEVGWRDPHHSARRCLSSPTMGGNPGLGKEVRPSRSSPAASRVSWSRRGMPRTARTSGSQAARKSSNSSSGPGL